MNRLTRDEILGRALDMVDSPSLDQKDRPGGVVQPNAMCIGWLQDALDLFHRTFPWTGLITSVAVNLVSGTASYTLPTNYTQDVHDGLRIMQTSPQIKRRLLRKSFSWLLSKDTTTDAKGTPEVYVILPNTIRVWPIPDTSYTAELWYYSLPTVLTPSQRPTFPDDWTLVEYVRLRGKEFTTEAEAGTAIKYARATISELLKSGLGIEGDLDDLPLDRGTWRGSGNTTSSMSDWMGPAVVR